MKPFPPARAPLPLLPALPLPPLLVLPLIFTLTLALPACGGAPFEPIAGSLPPLDPSSTPDAAPDSPAASALPDGAGEAARGGDDGSGACLQDLSGIGTGDFRVDFTVSIEVLPSAGWPGTVALVGQRTAPPGVTACDPTAAHWEVILSSGGGVETGLGDGAHAAGVEAGNGVADGELHRVSIVRRAGLLWYERDGVIGSAKVPAAYPLADLPPLTVGTNPCVSEPLAGLGTISDLCITTP